MFIGNGWNFRFARKRAGEDMERKLAGAFFGIVIVVVAFFGVVTPSFADDYVEEDGIRYFVNEAEKTAIVSHCDMSVSGVVSIPETISYREASYPVVSIKESAFAGCTNLESVTIPDGVTSIGEYAFSECDSLENVTIPDSVANIGEYAFSECASLVNIEIPNGITTIDTGTFISCSNLESIAIPDSVTLIEGGAFHGCSNLANVVIPESVTSIGGNAFRECTKLTSIKIPSSVETIGSAAFYKCVGLTNVEIQNGLTSIGSYAFAGCTNLGSVMIPESVTSIESNAFSDCGNLKDILVSGQTTLGTDVFSGTGESLHVWRYEIAESAATSADGKTHLKIVSVQDKNGATVSNSSDIPDGVIASGYVVDKDGSGGDPSAVYYDVWVAGVQVSNLNADDVLGDSDEGATVTYDENSATLTLNNAHLAVSDSRFAIYAEQDLTIVLIGDNSVTLDGSVEISGLTWQTSIAGGYVVPEPAAPIACKGGSLTVQNGSDNRGSLTATNDVEISYMNDSGSFMNCGIVATGTVDIRDAKVEASSSYVHADNGATECSYGIFAGQGIVFDGADVTAMGNEATWSAGVYSLTGDVRLNGSTKASGGRAVNHQNPYSAFSSGIYANEGSVCITGGSVEAIAASLTEGGAAYGVFGNRGISITGGTVHAIGAMSNMDGVDPIFGAGIYSSAGDVVISGASTQVEADGGFASEDIAGIYANVGNVFITDASVKASAQRLYDADNGSSVGIYAGALQIARSNSETGNIVLKGANVQTMGLTDSVQFSGNLTVIPTEGMWYSVDALEEARLGYPNPLWDDMATAAKGIQGSPFKTETFLEGNLVSGKQYLHFYNVADGSVADPGNPEDPTISEVLDKSKDSNGSNMPTDAKIPVLGESSLALPLILVACFALAVGVVALIRKREC